MTKREHETLQKRINKISEYRAEADRVFEKLKTLNATEGTGHRWCCAVQNVRDLLSCGKDYMWLYDKYVEACAKADGLSDLGKDLAELNFWK